MRIIILRILTLHKNRFAFIPYNFTTPMLTPFDCASPEFQEQELNSRYNIFYNSTSCQTNSLSSIVIPMYANYTRYATYTKPIR